MNERKDEFERVANWVNDMDAEWWPFLFMRPSPDRKMTDARVLALAILYGVFAGMMMNACIALSGKANHVHVLMLPAIATAMFFVGFRFTLAWAWNRRVDRDARAVGTDDTLDR